MPYITNWNLAQVFLDLPIGQKIRVKRLSGDYHDYNLIFHKPAIHSLYNCPSMMSAFDTKRNSGSAFVINYPVIKVDDSLEEVDGTVEDFTKSLYFNLGFHPCLECWKRESLGSSSPYDLMTPEELGNQHEKDLEQMRKYWQDHPDEFRDFLGS